MRTVVCKSGIRGWRARVRENYRSLAELKSFDETHGVSARLGYRSPESLWRRNPTIEGSVNPSDFRVVRRRAPRGAA